jgi:hypothetical protein
MGVFAIFFIPETKDRSLEEIDEMFMAGLPAWKFKGTSAIYVVNVRLPLYRGRSTSIREAWQHYGYHHQGGYPHFHPLRQPLGLLDIWLLLINIHILDIVPFDNF